MKKTLITGVILLAAGALLFGIGIAKGGNKNVYWKDGGFKIDDGKNVTKNFAYVNSIKLRSEDPVIIKRGSVRHVRVNYYTSTQVHKNVAQKTLEINDNDNEKYSTGFEIRPGVDNHKTLVQITVPEKMVLKSVSGVSTDSISLKDLNINRVNIGGDAKITLNKVNVKQKLSFANGSDLNLIRTTAPMLTTNMTYGNIYAENSKFTSKNSSLTSKSGNVDIKQSTFRSLRVSSTDGDITINKVNPGRKISASSNEGDILVVGASPKQINVNAASSTGHLFIFGKQNGHHQSEYAKSSYNLTSDNGDVTVKK